MHLHKNSFGRRVVIFIIISNLFLSGVFLALTFVAEREKALSVERIFLKHITEILEISLSEKPLPQGQTPEDTFNTLRDSIQPLVEKAVAGSPSVGAGFYSRKLDVIVAYAPAEKFGNLVGTSLPEHHSLRDIILTNNEDYFSWGDSLRASDTIRYVKPIFRNGENIGQVFANEPYDVFMSRVWKSFYSHLPLAFILILLTDICVILLYVNIKKQISRVHQTISQCGNAVTDTNIDAEFLPLITAMQDCRDTLTANMKAIEENFQLKDVAFNDSPFAHLIVDKNGRVMDANSQAVVLLQQSKHKLKSSSLFDILSPGINNFLNEEGQITPTNGKSFLVANEGDRREFQCYVTPLPSKEHNLMIVSLIDRTEEAVMRKQLFDMQKLDYIGQMASMTAHELKNPLAVINGYAQLGKDSNDHNKCIRYFNSIFEETNRMTDFIREMIYLQIPDSITFEQEPINELIQDCIDVISSKAMQNRVIITSSLDQSNPLAVINKPLLERALLNLLYNALDSMPSGGQLIVNTNYIPHSNRISIAISDTGIGIPEEHRQKIFNSFFTTKGERGSGLGLPAAHQIIVGSHKGELWFESTEGMGTTFYIILPGAKV